MPFVNRNGVNIFYEDTGGDGEVIFMTHGFGSGSKMWDGQMDLAKKFRVIRKDAVWELLKPGHDLTTAQLVSVF
jgi:pimeloyl-ACP methyl ester carboxylesterase